MPTFPGATRTAWLPQLEAAYATARIKPDCRVCPHRGVPLEWQPDQFLDPSASLIQCATHGALFLIESGECVAGPCAGQFLTALDSREDEQGIWVQL